MTITKDEANYIREANALENERMAIYFDDEEEKDRKNKDDYMSSIFQLWTGDVYKIIVSKDEDLTVSFSPWELKILYKVLRNHSYFHYGKNEENELEKKINEELNKDLLVG